MIRRLSGTIIDQNHTAVVLDIAGVGYQVYTSKPGTTYPIESAQVFHIHHAIRETASDLYGFTTRDELEIFELLLTLPKIGPKSAMQIMSQADIELLKEAVRNEDATYLSKMSGIGKKSAEKIVAGLKDKFEDLGFNEPASMSGAEGAGPSAHHSDTIDALIALGYPAVDARKAVQQLPPEIENANDAVREALKVLSS